MQDERPTAAPDVPQRLAATYAIDAGFLEAFRFLRTAKRVFATHTGTIEPDDLHATRILRAGLQVATESDDGLRLSVEGAALFGPASKRVLDLDAHDFRAWMEGRSPLVTPIDGGYVVLRHQGMYLGASCPGKSGRYLNFLRKGRRIARDADAPE